MYTNGGLDGYTSTAELQHNLVTVTANARLQTATLIQLNAQAKATIRAAQPIIQATLLANKQKRPLITTGNLAKLTKLYEIKLNIGAVDALVFSPDGSQLVSGGNQIQLWDAATGKAIQTFDGSAADAGHHLLFTPDGASITYNGSQWNVKTGEMSNANPIEAFSPDGVSALVIYDKSVLITNVQSPDDRPALTLEGASHPVRAAIYSPDGSLVGADSEDENIFVWSAATGKLLYQMKNEYGWGGAITFSRDGKHIIITSSVSPDVPVPDDKHVEAMISILNVNGQGTPIKAGIPKKLGTGGEGASIADLALSPDGRLFITSNLNGFLSIWDSSTGQLLATRKDSTTPVTAVAYSPDGTLLATTDSATIQVWGIAAKN